jgi:colanic acid/amylovoran biosynthesis glycosyltransferase
VRVCYVTMAFPAPYETFACSDVRALLRAGVTVSLQTLRPARPDGAQLLEEQQLRGVAVQHNSVRASFRGLAYGLLHPVVSVQLLVWLARHLWRQPRDLVRSFVLSPRALDILAATKADPPDVVHLFWGHYPAIVGYLVRHELPDVVLSMFLGAYDLEWGYGPSAPVASSADVVWTHARMNVPALERLGVLPERIRVRHRGLEVNRFADRLLPKLKGRVVAVGRLAAEKTMADVLAVFARVLPRHPTATLLVLGDGPERAELESLAGTLGIRDAVTFAGRVPQDVVRDELARAEVLLYMARSETDRLPNVIKEAMAARCLCVVTRTRGIDELLQDGVLGFIVRPGDIDAAAANVAWALEDRVGAGAIGEAGLAHVRAHFDVDRAVREYVARWIELVRARASVPGERVVEARHAESEVPADTGRAIAAASGAARSFPKP